MSVVQVFPSLWCWIWLGLSVDSVGLPSVVMWGDRGEIRCYGLSKVWNIGEGCDLHDLWFIMLEYAKDRFLGVDTPGQQVSPRVRYGMACLLIRDVARGVPCSDECEFGVVPRLGSHAASGAFVPQTTPWNLSSAMVLRTIMANLGIRPIVNRCNGM
jgi:hypothetical protein